LQPGSELGGIYAFKSGYHATRTDNKKNWPGDYSIVDTPDKGGLADKSAALDWTFPDAQAGHYATISKYTKRLMASAKDPHDPRLNGLREFFGQADNDLHVEGYDVRYDHEVTSDGTHLWHIHFSFSRNRVTDKKLMDNLLSVLRGETVAEWKGEQMLLLLQEKGKLAVYATDGLNVRWLPTGAVLASLRPMAINDGKITQIPVGKISDYGVLIGPTPE
jgi:hypothetical protein